MGVRRLRVNAVSDGMVNDAYDDAVDGACGTVVDSALDGSLTAGRGRCR
jgi:hypothetical protein